MSSEHKNNTNLLFFLAFLNHLLWSTLTVASRYLQVYAQPKVFDGQAVLATSKATSAILIYTASVLNICSEAVPSSSSSTSAANTDDKGDDNKEEENINDEDGTKSSTPDSEEATTAPTLKKKIFFGLLFGATATCRAALNIASAKFTLSYYVTTVNSLSPLVVSVGDTLLLKTNLPRAIWPCAVASFFGCAIIGLSQSPFFNNDANITPFTSQDAIGCGLQFASMCFSSAARLLMKSTQDILTRNEALQVNNICNSIFPVVYTLIVNPRGWVAFRYMNGPSFLAWLTVAVLVYTIASTGQMSLVRSMGPGLYSSLSAIRVLASALISAVCLNEPVHNWMEWLGLFVTMATMTIYTLASVDLGSTTSNLIAKAMNGGATTGAAYTQISQINEEDCETNTKDWHKPQLQGTSTNKKNELELTAYTDPLKDFQDT